jgi:hypothetical protein
VDTSCRKLKSKEAEDLSTKKETGVLGTKGGKSEGSHKDEENTTKVDAKTKKDDSNAEVHKEDMITTEEVNQEQNANNLETKAAEIQEIQEIDESEHKNQ